MKGSKTVSSNDNAVADSVSSTGYIIASGLVKLARDPKWQHYLTPEMNRLNSAFSIRARDSLTKRIIDWLPPGFAIWLMDTMFVPGLMQHYIFRKRYIEQQVIHAIGQGTSQVINLGAGFDTLALRIASAFPAVQFIEIDRPATQKAKLDALPHIHYDVPSNAAFISSDLAQQEIGQVFSSQSGFDPGKSTLVILEGVLMYLSESEVKKLFSDLAQLCTASLTIVYGAIIPSEKRDALSVRLVNALLRRGNEEPKWLCASRHMATFASGLGYRLKEWVAYRKLQEDAWSNAELEKLPKEDENYYVIEKISPVPAIT